MLDKADKAKDAATLGKRWKSIRAKRRAAIAAQHRDLRTVQRAQREFLQQLLEVRGETKGRLLQELALLHRRQHRDLDAQIRASDRAERAREPAVPSASTWSPLWPRAAQALRDHQSLAYWNGKVTSLSDQEFIEWLRLSHAPLIRRPPDTPDFDELMTLESVRKRLNRIGASRDTALQKQLQQVLVPTTRGRKPAEIDPQVREKAKAFQGTLTRLLQQLRDGDRDAGRQLNELLRSTFPTWMDEELRALIKKIAPNKRWSKAAAYVAGLAFDVAPSRVRQGKVPKPSPDRRTKRRLVVGVENVEKVQLAQEATRRGRRPRPDHD